MKTIERKEACTKFNSQLAAFTGRTSEAIMDQGLLASDFKGNVDVIMEDGSALHLKHAFMVSDVNHVLVLSEHNGYFIFNQDEVLSCSHT